MVTIESHQNRSYKYSKKGHVMKKLLLCMLMWGVMTANAEAQYSVQCTGYDNNTSSMVYGECTDASFSGYDSETGQWVYGSCSFAGSLDAYNSETNDWVYGNCEGE